MDYIQSNAIRNHWLKIGYNPSFEEKAACAAHNFSLSLWERIEALKTIIAKSGVQNKEIDDYLYTVDKYAKKFESSEEDEPHLYYFDGKCLSNANEFLFDIAADNHFSTIEELKAHIVKVLDVSLRCYNLSSVREFYFYVSKIYIKGLRKIDVKYRYRGGEFEIVDIDLVEAEEGNNKVCEYDFYYSFPSLLNVKFHNIPFKKGEIVKDISSGNRLYVIKEVRDSELDVFYFDDEGLLQECTLTPIFYDYPSNEEGQSSIYAKLNLISSCIEKDISTNELIDKLKEVDA